MWTEEEDQLLRDAYMRVSAESDEPLLWNTIAAHVPGRTGKQCRERWVHHLQPSVHKGEWTEEEDVILYEQMTIHGRKWSEVAKYLPGRTDQAIKNR